MSCLSRLVACLFLCVSLNSFGALYGMDEEHRAYEIDTNTGAYSLIATLPGAAGTASSLAYGNNTLYALNQEGLYTIDPQSGQTEKYAYFGSYQTGLAFNSVPIPATAWLLGSGLAVLIAARRKAKTPRMDSWVYRFPS